MSRRDEMVSLREYFEALRVADERALAIAREEIDRRLDAMNEMREQMSAERGRYLERETYELRHQVLIDLIEKHSAHDIARFAVIDQALAQAEGERSGSTQARELTARTTRTVIAVLGLMIALLTLVASLAVATNGFTH